MSNELQIFSYESHEIRTVLIDGEAWFVAKDVCDILELSNPTEALKSLDDDERSSLRITEGTSPNGGNPNVNVINEPGLYKLTFKSRKPIAKEFTRWVTHKVLPEIRRTGSYNAQQYSAPVNVRAAEVLKNTVQYLSSSEEKRAFTREIYRLVTGQELPKKAPAPKPAHTPRYWTVQQVATAMKWQPEAVMHRAERLELTKESRYGYFDGDTWYFSKEGRQKFMEHVRDGIVKIEDGYEYYENGDKRIHWRFDPCGAVLN
jgi:prophage antirepressor-like protein